MSETPAVGPLERLQAAIERAAELLPAPGPITAFVFLNTLQALEDLPFDAGLRQGARLFGCQPYLTEDRFRDKLARGRIRREDLEAVVREDLGERSEESVGGLTTRRELRLAMLEFAHRTGPTEELRWFVAETDALSKVRGDAPPGVRARLIEETRYWIMRDLRPTTEGPVDGARDERGARDGDGASATRDERMEARFGEVLRRHDVRRMESWRESTWEAAALQTLWRVCGEAVRSVPHDEPPGAPLVRLRDRLLAATGLDADGPVHELLIRFTAAFADQGFADWELPGRERGYLRAFSQLYRAGGGPPQAWLAGLPGELERLEREQLSPLDSVRDSLDRLGVPESRRADVVTSSLLALRGWAGMLRQMEVRGDRVPRAAPPGTLVEFLAVRLILERLAAVDLGRRALGFRGTPAELAERLEAAEREGGARPVEGAGLEQRTFVLFEIAQLFGWSAPRLDRLDQDERRQLLGEIDRFSGIERRRMFHLALERRFRTQALDAVALHAARARSAPRPKPRFQSVFCIDAREESFRRHLEEHAPDAETFGAAGFFGIPMYYRGVADAHYSTLCPIVLRPKHWVIEEVVFSLAADDRRRKDRRKKLGAATHQVHVGSRSIARGALLTAGLGVLASVPLIARVLFPRLAARVRQTAGRLVEAPPVTRLRLERSTPEPGMEDEQIGFTVDEMATFGERLLRDIGLTSGFARLVLFLGHGSACLNNPHKSAYDCGACSGSGGGPNARALAAMLNDLRVRELLAGRGLPIPRETYFLGGQHNTAVDSITFYDLDLLPHSHVKDVEAAADTLAAVCERNAHERCRRFYSAPLDITPQAAKRHVEERAEDLAQTRPEFGNATNALCVVGRRLRTRGLYLDRRSFLVSYDPHQDDSEYQTLGRVLGAVVPVCEGINLQYYFSYVDSAGWGCGTKLPHNVTSLLGVMDGAASDLRSGLPMQGVEIHEPLRLLFVIEAPPAALEKIMQRNPAVARILQNGWVQLALAAPDSDEILVYRDGRFEPYSPTATELPRRSASQEWYRGWREHLAFAQITSEDAA